MPRDYSKPPRSDRPKREGAPEKRGFVRKPWERQSEEGRPARRFSKPYGEGRDDRGPRPSFRDRDDRGPRRGFGGDRDSRPPRKFDDELYTATGRVADVVGSEPQSRFDMLRKLWDFFREERLVIPAARRPRPNADLWRAEGEERPRREYEAPSDEERPAKRPYRKPAGNHPTARKAKSLEGVPRRKFKETREK